MARLTPIFESLLLHERELRGFLRKRLDCSEDAADLFQRIAERMLKKPPADVDNDRAYLFQTAANAVVDHHRAESSYRKLGEQQLAEEDELDEIGPDRQLIARESVAALERALAELPPLTRRIFLLYRLEGLSQQVIADRLGISRSTVERRLKKAVAHTLKRFDGPGRAKF